MEILKAKTPEKNIFSLLMLVSIGCFIIMLVLIFIFFFSSNSNNNYGDRLNGINDIVVSKERLQETENSLSGEKNVQKAKIRLQGKIFHITIFLEDGGSVNDGINAGGKILEKFTDEEKSFYDLSFIITKNDLSSEDKFPILGYKNCESKNISWSYNAQ